MKRIFLAGIIQGSIGERAVFNQDYRDRIRRSVAAHLPQAELYCPVTAHPNSIEYDDAKARSVFFEHVEMVRRGDMVVAYLPSASMGTAIELWEAHHSGTAVVTITPLAVNWVVRFLSDLVVPDLDAFDQACRDGRVAWLLDRPRPARPINGIEP